MCIITVHRGCYVQEGTVHESYCTEGYISKMKHYKINANYTSKPAQWPYFIKTLEDLSVKEVKRRFVARFSWLKVFTCEEIPEDVAIEENNFDWWIIL